MLGSERSDQAGSSVHRHHVISGAISNGGSISTRNRTRGVAGETHSHKTLRNWVRHTRLTHALDPIPRRSLQAKPTPPRDPPCPN